MDTVNKQISLLLYLILLVGLSFSAISRNKYDYRDEDGDVIEVRETKLKRTLDALDTLDDLYREVRLNKRGCACYCRRKWSEDDWSCCACSWTDAVCFPATSRVTLENGTAVPMSQLQRGHRILTATTSGDLAYSKVVTFMKRNPEEVGVYRRLVTEAGQQITLSDSHVIFTRNLRLPSAMTNKFAKDIKIGDVVFVSANATLVESVVINIQVEIMEGVYVPLTEEGTVIVDGVLASCYAAFDHTLAHAAMTPLRWFPWLLDTVDVGIQPYVHYIKMLGRWIMPLGLQDGQTRLWSLFWGQS